MHHKRFVQCEQETDITDIRLNKQHLVIQSCGKIIAANGQCAIRQREHMGKVEKNESSGLNYVLYKAQARVMFNQ